ncbi:lysophospholipid acyltransferase family protein [Haloferula sp. A504]|uniref:lysophospholipid acyltransferase family protein n=1 Tax=Haloferula sp. A504 TaxID=3373601 RepID=UPI0031CBF495|nr:lysophospholipid acyltransferase family protein [Verrucomicrobiaceae bacterium E54]
MSESDPPQTTIFHRLEFLLFRGMERVLGGISLADTCRLGRAAGRMLHALTPRHRRIVRRNLRIATVAEAPSPEQLRELVLEVYRRAGANFLAALKTPTLDLDAVHEATLAEGTEHLGGRGPGHRGVILTMAHMGNWEATTRLCKAYVGEADYGGVYRPLGNPLLDQLTQSRRSMDGAKMFSRKDGFHAPAALLRDGGMLGVLADHKAGARGVAIPFFGKLTTCSPLPTLLAKRGRADVTVLSMATESPGRWRLGVRPMEGKPEVGRIMSALEASMRTSLTDVFWFHDRWRVNSLRPLSLFTRIDPEQAAAATVPLRMVLSLPHDLEAALRIQITDRLLASRPDLRLDLLGDDPALAGNDRIAIHRWDPDQPPEHADATLRRIDESHPAPLDGVILFGGEKKIARAAKRAGIRAIVGVGVAGKPWSSRHATPTDPSGWLAIVDELAWVPPRFRK